MADNKAEVKILTVDAVSNLNDLKQAIKDTKDELAKQTLGSERYQELLGELIKEQNLMRGAMNGTTADMETLKKATDGSTYSYNGLVNSMANAKRELRNLDLATQAGRDRYVELSREIKNTNEALKKLDEDQGSYVRNVGNYTSGLKNLGQVLKDYVPSLGGIAKGVDDVDKSVALLGKQPLLGIIGLLAPLLVKIADSLKEDDNAMKAVKKTMDALKPVTDFFANVLDEIVGLVSNLITEVSQFFSGSNIFQKIIQGLVGVGNAIVKFVVAPFKGISAAIKVFKEQGIKGLGDAVRAFNEEADKGIAFKTNFETGQKIATAMMSGAKSRRREAQDAGKTLGKEIAKAIAKEVSFDKDNKNWEKAKESFKKELDSIVDDLIAQDDALIQADLDAMEKAAEEEEFYQNALVEGAKKAAEQKLAIMSAFADGVSDLMSSVADLLESNEDASEKQVKAAKNLRIAAATIDMISGAVTAYSTAQELGPIAGPIVGAINAAAVVASGLANIAKIKATTVSKDSAPSTSFEAPAAATVAAPALESVTPTTVMTGASTETALNNAARSQRVYILQSDIEAAGNTSRTRVAESSF